MSKKKKKEESPKIYSLYEKPEFVNFLSLAYSEEEVKEESQYHTGGTWYVADHVDNKFIINEVPYEKKVKFPKNPKKRELSDLYKKTSTIWVNRDDLR